MTTKQITHHRLGAYFFLFLFGAALMTLGAFAQNSGGKEGVILTLNGPVTPPIADYLEREIGIASDAGKDLIILEIDTPGGLVDSMKTIIKAILASETPVATYVSPQGARSASAGLYIMYGAHISAMAPATNTGAATPIDIGGGGTPSRESPFDENDPGFSDEGAEEPAEDLTGDSPVTNDRNESISASQDDDTFEPRNQSDEVSAPTSSEDALRAKVINDSVAYIRALAEKRDRNADWGEDAVRDAVSITANEALDLNVIDLIADDIDDLLAQIDGQVVAVASGEKTLDTKNLRLERVEPTLTERFLSFIANPNVAVILMSLATTGIIIEMWNPGSLFPGGVGILCLLLGLYSFQVLPFNSLGMALMGVGVLFMVLEAYSPTFGLSGLVGMALFGTGMYFLFPEALRVSIFLIGFMMALIGSFLLLILFALVRSRGHGPMIGAEAIRKREGIVDEWDGKEGWVIVEGERWRARGDKPFEPGTKVRVVEVDGLVLVVKQAKAATLIPNLLARET